MIPKNATSTNRILAAACMLLLFVGGAPAGLSQPADPQAIAEQFVGIEQVPAALGCVALTFDDGPHATYTPAVLSVLAEEGVVATFFVLGERVVNTPELTNEIVAAGHEIGNHSWSHASLPTLTAAEIQAEIDNTDQAIVAATGQPATLFRPPYGDLDERVFALANRPVALWDVDPLDLEIPTASSVVEHIIWHARSGSIIVLHDIFRRDVEALRSIIRNLSDRGYQFVTVSRLLTGEPCPGPIYDTHLAKLAAADTPANAGALDPTFGEASFGTSSTRTLQSIDIVAGGAIQADEAIGIDENGNACEGMIASAPDFRVQYSSDRAPLIFLARGREDLTLAIRAPDGKWYCDDDGAGGHDSLITLAEPQSGQYDVWVGVFHGGLFEASLIVSEAEALLPGIVPPLPVPLAAAP